MAKRKRHLYDDRSWAASLIDGPTFWIIPLIVLVIILAFAKFLHVRHCNIEEKYDWGVKDLRHEDYHLQGHHEHHRGE